MSDLEEIDVFRSGAVEQQHGPANARRSRYLPTYVLRGLQAPQLELDAAD
jgi:hypothetical protein